MIAKATCIMISLLIAVPAEAGGFLADIAIRPFNLGAAQSLDSAHQNIGKALAIPDPLSGSASVVASPSKTCVTPQISCEVASPALTGTTCFCDVDKNQVFGRIQ